MKIDLTEIDYVISQGKALIEYGFICHRGLRRLLIFKRFCELKSNKEKYMHSIIILSIEFNVGETTVRRAVAFCSYRFPEIIRELERGK